MESREQRAGLATERWAAEGERWHRSFSLPLLGCIGAGSAEASPNAGGSVEPHTVELTAEDRAAISKTRLSVNSDGRLLAYRAHVRNLGWSRWVTSASDGFAGWTGKGEPIEAVEVSCASAPVGAILDVRAHWSGVGWSQYSRVPAAGSGTKLLLGTAGVAGPSLEALTFGGDHANYYKADGHVKDIGWQQLDQRATVRAEIGTTGKSLWMEAFRVSPFEAYTEPVNLSRVSGSSDSGTSVNASKKHWRSKDSATGNAAESAVVARFDAWHDAGDSPFQPGRQAGWNLAREQRQRREA
ncbi:hypothetical protein [Streptomyces sp. CBMA156]|uniref:hypothetical protein n=1 Tax=Streptomyces sp. CBMA156 TaxID=1930280 RepID=UPI001661EC18|nr:hypothetical protein [Streptomyces sp. CBMA156]